MDSIVAAQLTGSRVYQFSCSAACGPQPGIQTPSPATTGHPGKSQAKPLVTLDPSCCQGTAGLGAQEGSEQDKRVSLGRRAGRQWAVPPPQSQPVDIQEMIGSSAPSTCI
ncbi:unnamed protein product [Rangifer tarandus platyrhynchus]|uniref:Uncharacterized protein n=2 Tax=Rangifer tarandus platyrhynchus TaxID=3082113 RepID=A0ABN8YWG7_RANTA|nr:unnamed protein product [Rangifer tarandus platyrhynchus]